MSANRRAADSPADCRMVAADGGGHRQRDRLGAHRPRARRGV
eukprot:ctg_5387.g475